MAEWFDHMLKRIWRKMPPALGALYFRAMFAVRPKRPPAPPVSAPPYYVCGPFRSNSGMGRGARLYAAHLEKMGLPLVRVDITAGMRMDPELPGEYAGVDSLKGKKGGTVVIHANPPQMQLAMLKMDAAFLASAHITAYWAWEMEHLPPVWLHALDYVDSINTPSAFTSGIIKKYTAKPVSTVPHALQADAAKQKDFAPDGILRCLCIFDAGSSFERKNPLAVLEAFAKAFRPGEAVLVFKVSHPGADEKAFADFSARCAAVPGVEILTGTLSDAQMGELYLRHDVCLSLHRGEGYGLTLAEALAHGLHVVATGWSGNMDFMAGPLAHAVPCSIVENSKGFRWADPDIDACAEILRGLYENLALKRV